MKNHEQKQQPVKKSKRKPKRVSHNYLEGGDCNGGMSQTQLDDWHRRYRARYERDDD